MSVPIAPVACDLRTLLTPPFLYFEFVPPKTGYLGLLSLTRVKLWEGYRSCPKGAVVVGRQHGRGLLR